MSQEKEIIGDIFLPKIVCLNACFCGEHAVCTILADLNLDSVCGKQQETPDFFHLL